MEIARSKWFAIEAINDSDEVIVCGDEVLVFAVSDDNCVLLIEEPAYAFEQPALLLPGGAVKAGEPILAAALRELREETGYAARVLSPFATVRPWSKYLRVSSHMVLARGLYVDPLDPDEAHAIGVRLFSADALRRAIADGSLKDARVIAAAYMTRFI